ncbi:MAG: sulfite exporter TauE/SafE family protein [Gammaproteobacteria bacterium]
MQSLLEISAALPLVAALCAAGAAAGITAGLFGNGGGFVIVPAMVTLLEHHAQTSSELIFTAIGTSLACITVTTARAIYAHHLKGAVDFEVVLSWAAWVFLGVMLGLSVVSFVDATALFFLFSAGVFAYSLYFLFPDAFAPRRSNPAMPTGIPRAALASGLGAFSSLLGIGGGTVTVITMVTCGRPIHQAVATASGIGFVIGLSGTLGFVFLGLGQPQLLFGSLGYVNVPALLVISSLALLTAPVGAGWAHRLDARVLKRVFGVYLVFASASMLYKGLGA